jgi:hypothetical protein
MATFLSIFGRESRYFNGLIVLKSRKHGLEAAHPAMHCKVDTTRLRRCLWISLIGALMVAVSIAVVLRLSHSRGWAARQLGDRGRCPGIHHLAGASSTNHDPTAPIRYTSDIFRESTLDDAFRCTPPRVGVVRHLLPRSTFIIASKY